MYFNNVLSLLWRVTSFCHSLFKQTARKRQDIRMGGRWEAGSRKDQCNLQSALHTISRLDCFQPGSWWSIKVMTQLNFDKIYVFLTSLSMMTVANCKKIRLTQTSGHVGKEQKTNLNHPAILSGHFGTAHGFPIL